MTKNLELQFQFLLNRYLSIQNRQMDFAEYVAKYSPQEYIIMTEELIGNSAGIIFFAIATIRVITAVIRRRKRLTKNEEPTTSKVTFETKPDVDTESDVEKLLKDLKGDESSRD